MIFISACLIYVGMCLLDNSLNRIAKALEAQNERNASAPADSRAAASPQNPVIP